MITTTPAFDTGQQADFREITWSVGVSFDKTFNAATTFFTLDQSVLDGPDLLQGTGDVIQEWDKYEYTDYSDRVISIEWQRSEDFPYSIRLATATITFDNTDDFFTPGQGSAIDGNIRPARPIRISVGFNENNIETFVGLTNGLPLIDSNRKRATFQCSDFLSFIFDKNIDETTSLINKRSDEIISTLLTDAGVLPAQLQLATGRNTVPFSFFVKNNKLGRELREVIKAEAGFLYMSETGQITFDNYTYRQTTPVYTLDSSNVVSYRIPGGQGIINTVNLKSSVREVQDKQPLWQSVEPVTIPAGGSVTVWADFLDPAISLTTPIQSAEINDSYYTASGTVTVTGTLFVNSYKMVFSSVGGGTITDIELWGEPARVTNIIRTTTIDQPSIDNFGEKVYDLTSDYIQTESDAGYLSQLILHAHAEYEDVLELVIKANPALQVGDPITVTIDNVNDTYYITSIDNVIRNGSYRQRVRVKNIVVTPYFILDQSVLDGTDVLGF